MPTDSRSNSRGILLVILSMAAFAGEDALIKLLSGGYSVGQILLMINILAAVFFVIVARLNGDAIFARQNWRPLLVLRASTEGIGALLFATALAKVEISVVAAVFQTTPLATTMGAALFLNEKVGWRRWLAIIIGFFGVLLIVRPGGEAFNPFVLMVLGTVVLITARDLITRNMDVSVPSSVVAFQGLGAIAPTALLLMLLSGSDLIVPGAADMTRVVFAALGGIIGYITLITALRIADTGVIMPFRFSRLVFSILLGVLIFAERPDALTITGSLLILASGLYTFLRERKLAKLAKKTAAEELQTHGF
ncbi:DMT family transporter [Celeribacter litoreus]|uniref:DMT family transporter n=1 Tax=Celeribacter litoreus TaxID=2876714 RepID=UPI001CCDC0A4|nr:DMT family transporter [Celeribacter litoreus]MCA0044732.1 DMT family transporter [Celeribacter litoreus]